MYFEPKTPLFRQTFLFLNRNYVRARYVTSIISLVLEKSPRTKLSDLHPRQLISKNNLTRLQNLPEVK
jgi:hypothetical protein